jgi:hypothetical protein
MFNASFLSILFVWFALCLMALDSYIIISEFHFELPKEFFEFLTTQKIQFFSIKFVIKNKCHMVVFWQGLYFVYVITIG